MPSSKEQSLEYNVAGPADDEDYAQAEYLAEMLMVSLPSIKCNCTPLAASSSCAAI